MTSANPAGELPFVPFARRFEPRGEMRPTAAVHGVRSPRSILLALDRKDGVRVAVRRVPNSVVPELLSELCAANERGIHPAREALRDDQGAYLVSELDRGTLDEAFSTGALDAAELAAVAFDLAYGLQALHQAGFAPVEPSPDVIVRRNDGSVGFLALALPFSSDDASSAAIGDPIAHDLKLLGRVLVALARGKPFSEDSTFDEAPPHLRPVIQRCLTAGGVSGYDDTTQLITDLRGRAEDSRGFAEAGSETIFDSSQGGAILDLASDSTRGTRGSAPFQRLPTGSENPQGSQTPPTQGKSRSDSGKSKSRIEPFPFRPLEELYDLVGTAGTGGMGAVAIAVEKSTHRKVAVKRLKSPHDLSDSTLERFYREAHSIANLNHPHILQLLQPGRDAAGDYLVLEFADGGSLKDKLNRGGPLSESEVLDIARKIGSALSYAHKKGVIHRDIKPHNILLTETGEPKLADFGLARSVDDMTLSTSKGGAGSPLYMAPEQHNSSHDADARSDLYSFGKTLYQLLTGKLPNSPDPKLLPPSLRGPILHCMEEDPAQRPASVDVFLRELERSTRPATYRVAAVAAISLLLTLGVWVLKNHFGRDDSAKDLPEHEVPEPPEHKANDPPHVVTKSIAATLFAMLGDKEEPVTPVANGKQAQVIAKSVAFKIDLSGTKPESIDLDKIEVSRNGHPLDAKQREIKVDGPSLRVVANLDEGAGPNEFTIKVPDLGETTRSVERVLPSVAVGSVSPAVRVDDSWITKDDPITVSGRVTNSLGLASLRLVDPKTQKSFDVAIQDGHYAADLALGALGALGATGPSDSTLELEWRLPADRGGDIVSTEPLRLTLDRTDPLLALDTPRSEVVLGAKTEKIGIHGTLRESHLPKSPAVELGLYAGDPKAAVGSGWTAPVTVVGDEGSFEKEIAFPEKPTTGRLTLMVKFTDAAGRSTILERPFEIDRESPRIVSNDGKLQVRVARDGKNVKLSLEGTASEALAKASVNGVEATIDGDGNAHFHVDSLPKADSYVVSIEDRAGNVATLPPLYADTNFDTTPPRLDVFFDHDAAGIAILVVKADEPLETLEIGGMKTAADADGAYRKTLRYALADMRDPTWGPTNDSIAIAAVDKSGNRVDARYVAAPLGLNGTDPFGGPVGIELGKPNSHGQYCPQLNMTTPHPESTKRKGVAQDWFVWDGTRRCGYCGWMPDSH